MGCLARDVNPPKIILLLSALIRGEREEARFGRSDYYIRPSKSAVYFLSYDVNGGALLEAD